MKVSAAVALLLAVSAALEPPEALKKPEQPLGSAEQQPQQQQQQQKNWQKFVPSFARKFVKQGLKTEAKKKEAHTPTTLVAEPLALAAGATTQDRQDDSVSVASTEEAAAKLRAQTELERLQDIGVQELESEAASWSSVDELAEASRDRNADAAEQTLQNRIQMLSNFLEKPRKTVLDFNTTQAVELVSRVNSAAADVQRMAQEQKEKMQAEFKKAKKAAVEKVKSMEQEARLAARQWKAKGKETIHAEKAARLGEDVWERHSDVLSDAAGDLSDRAEYFAERLQDKVGDYFSSLNDQLRGTRANQRTEELLSRAKLVVRRVRQMAASLGAEEAYKEAKSTAAFQAEEKKWEQASAARAPEATQASLAAAVSESPSSTALASLPVQSRPASSLAVVGAASIAAVVFVALRPRPMSLPEIEAPPLLG